MVSFRHEPQHPIPNHREARLLARGPILCRIPKTLFQERDPLQFPDLSPGRLRRSEPMPRVPGPGRRIPPPSLPPREMRPLLPATQHLPPTETLSTPCRQLGGDWIATISNPLRQPQLLCYHGAPDKGAPSLRAWRRSWLGEVRLPPTSHPSMRRSAWVDANLRSRRSAFPESPIRGRSTCLGGPSCDWIARGFRSPP